jgi:hypothetical protein
MTNGKDTVEYKIKPPTLRVGGLILYCGSVRINYASTLWVEA